MVTIYTHHISTLWIGENENEKKIMLFSTAYIIQQQVFTYIMAKVSLKGKRDWSLNNILLKLMFYLLPDCMCVRLFRP